MPIFEYRCTACDREFEALVRSAGPGPCCPDCGGSDLQKRMSTFAALGTAATASPEQAAACGACGHPGGPGACQLD